MLLLLPLRVAPPQFDGLVIFQRCRGDYILSGMTSAAQDHIGVATQTLHDLLRLQIPDVDHVVLGARDNPLAACH